jgi:hypothetical protein
MKEKLSKEQREKFDFFAIAIEAATRRHKNGTETA